MLNNNTLSTEIPAIKISKTNMSRKKKQTNQFGNSGDARGAANATTQISATHAVGRTHGLTAPDCNSRLQVLADPYKA